MKQLYLIALVLSSIAYGAPSILEAKVRLNHPVAKNFELRLEEKKLIYKVGREKKQWKLDACRWGLAYIFWKEDLEPQSKRVGSIRVPASFAKRVSPYDSEYTSSGKKSFHLVNSANTLRFMRLEDRLNILNSRFERFCKVKK